MTTSIHREVRPGRRVLGILLVVLFAVLGLGGEAALGIHTLGTFRTTSLIVDQGAKIGSGLTIAGLTSVTGGITGLPAETCGAGSAVTGFSTTGSATCGAVMPSGGITGSGTANNVSMWTGTTTQGNLAGSATFAGDLVGSVGSGAEVRGAAAASGTTPTLVPNQSGPTYGIGGDATHVFIIANGVDELSISTSAIAFLINAQSSNANSWRLNINNASATVPTLIPNESNSSTGIGADASGDVSVIASATEIERWTSIGAIVIPTGGVMIGSNGSAFELINSPASSTVPTLIPNRTIATSGVGADVPGDVSLITAGSEKLRITSTSIAGLVSISANTTGGYRLPNIAASATVPSFNPNSGDITTGIGELSTGNMSFISTATEVARVTSTSLVAILKFSANAHVLTTGTALTVSNLSCNGTGTPAVATNSTDVAGTITENTLATSCTLTFAATYTNAPFCQCSPTSGTPFLVGCTSTATTLVFNNASATGDVITYTCVAPTGST